jgi:hypothetical protein
MAKFGYQTESMKFMEQGNAALTCIYFCAEPDDTTESLSITDTYALLPESEAFCSEESCR